MKSNLAIKNIRKKLNDYGIYFFTLSLAVCIFYTFNSIDGQEKILSAQTGNRVVMEQLVDIMGYISIFVSVILGSLIIYANKLLIKKRRVELGIYMSLGMGKGKISRILIIEEFIIGIASLVIGLILGIIASQGLAILSGSIFAIELNEFKIVFSNQAVLKTIGYFTLIFITVIIFNVITVSKYKLIDLINSNKKNEVMKVKNIKVNIIIFIISIVTLICAYSTIIRFGFWNMEKLVLSIILGTIGTVLFFYSVMSILAYRIEKKEKLYYRSINIFTIKQIKSKINTNFMSISVICLMLFVTISVLSLSIGFKNRELDKFTPFDMTIGISAIDRENTEEAFKIPEEIREKRMDFKYIGTGKYNKWGDEEILSFKEILEPYADEAFKSDFAYENYGPQVISLSDYNKILKMQGRKEINIKEDEYILINTTKEVEDDLERFLKAENGEIRIDGKKYIAKDNKIFSEQISNQHPGSSWYMIIVGNDEWVNKEKAYNAQYNINYSEISEKSKKYIEEAFKESSYQKIKKGEETWNMISISKEDVQLQQSIGTIMMLYVSLYIGAIFLIASALVLGIQIISEAFDSKERYSALRRIGARESEINRSILIQIGVYYLFPIVLALIHSVIGIYVGNEVLVDFGKSSVIQSAIGTMLFIIIIYISYFFIAYFSYKNTVKD